MIFNCIYFRLAAMLTVSISDIRPCWIYNVSNSSPAGAWHRNTMKAIFPSGLRVLENKHKAQIT